MMAVEDMNRQEVPWVPLEAQPRARSLTCCRSTGGLVYCGLLYGERWYGTGQRCRMRWAGGDTQRRDRQEPVENIRR